MGTILDNMKGNNYNITTNGYFKDILISIAVETVMKRVVYFEWYQRVGDGESPIRVEIDENHF
jgi:hypothetical protein